jgi:hypothetical protein
MGQLEYFSFDELKIVNDSVVMAEELVSNTYKLSSSQLLRLNYDVKTLIDLSKEEIVDDHFAQILRYTEKKKNDLRDASINDFYKICLQDHSIINALRQYPELDLFAFVLYVVSHELIHIVRFRRFLQHFDAPLREKNEEEMRVHEKTREILYKVNIDHLKPVLKFYENWHQRPHNLADV